MKFYAVCYWQQARNVSALLLQQYVCEGTPVHFACVCDGREEDERAGGYMTERLLGWFRNLSLRRLARRTERALGEAVTGLERIVRKADGELEEAGITEPGRKMALAGLFCVGEEFFLYYRGGQRIYFINTGFGRGHVKRLGEDSEELCVERGRMQPDIGLLFGTASFRERITEGMIRECLSVGEAATEERMQRRLKELGEEAGRLGGKNLAAFFFRTVSNREA